MNTRSFVVLAVTAGVLAAPHGASAADLYVSAGAGATTCAHDDPCSLQQAIVIADIVSNLDTIHVTGPLDHAGPVDLSNSPIDLIGSGNGPGGTAIDAGTDSVTVGADSSARALSVRSAGTDAVVLHAAGAIDDIHVVGTTNGVYVEPRVGAELATIRDVHVVARNGITEDAPLVDANAFHAERATVEATHYGIVVQNANAKITNSVVRTRTSGGRGILAFNTADVDIEDSSIDGGGNGAVGVHSGPGTGATVVLSGSIVRGFGTDVSADHHDIGYALSVSDSNFATKNGIGIGDLGGNIDADPEWLDAANGDYRIGAGSPVIDRGATRAATPGETDRAGNPRVVDGDGDGAQARDIGAYEFQPPTPGDPGPSGTQDAPAGPAVPTGGQPPAPTTTPPPSSTAPPATAFKVRLGKLALNRRGRGTVNVACSARPCTVRLVLATTAKRPRTLARASARRSGAVTFQLSRSARAYIKKRRIRRVVVTATAVDGTGRRTQVRRTVRLPRAAAGKSV